MGKKFHFPNVTRLILCKFLLFPKIVHKFKIGIFENWFSEILSFFANLQKSWKSRYLNVALGWILKLPNSEIEIWYFPMLNHRCTNFFPIHWRDLENLDYWVLVRKRQMNKSGWKLEIFKWIFSHFRKANLNISQPCWLGYFWSFQKSKFQKFNRWNEILPYPPYWVMVNRALLGNEPTMSFNLWAKVNSLMSYTPNLKPCFTSLFLITGQCRLIFKYAALHNYWMVPWVIFIPYINIPPHLSTLWLLCLMFWMHKS